MRMDISHMSDEQLKKLPADEDWSLTLPDGYPDLLVTTAWRDQLCADTACQFVRWVLNEERVEITHEYDPPWDSSGEARHAPTDMKTLLDLHDTLEEWLMTEYTGEQEAGFEAGVGWFWHTFDDDLEDEIEDRIHELVRSQLTPVIGEDEAALDQMWDDVYLVELSLHQALRLLAGKMTTLDAWKNYRALVNEQIEEQRRQTEAAEAWAAQRQTQINRFWERYFANLTGLRIEKPEFYALNLAERLTDVLADTDPDIVEIIAQIGLPGDFSNSVMQAIQAIAKKALAEF